MFPVPFGCSLLMGLAAWWLRRFQIPFVNLNLHNYTRGRGSSITSAPAFSPASPCEIANSAGGGDVSIDHFDDRNLTCSPADLRGRVGRPTSRDSAASALPVTSDQVAI